MTVLKLLIAIAPVPLGLTAALLAAVALINPSQSRGKSHGRQQSHDDL